MSTSRRILIQAGHYNTKNNCDSRFRGMTGAPEEQRHNYEIALKLIDLLNKNGYEAHFTDANVNCPSNDFQTNRDWDLFLSLHCDANYTGDQGGGFVDYPDPSVDDSNTESKRIKEAIEAEYFAYTGIRNVPSRSNPNTKFYYAWSNMTSKTPCVILEMGESIDPHDSVILNDVDRVANGILKGIKRAFPIVSSTPVQTENSEIVALKNKIKELEKHIEALNSEHTKKLAENKAECQAVTKAVKDAHYKQLQDIKKLIDKFINEA